MKTVLGAIALILAVPAAAQTAPATDPHAGHAQHQQHQGEGKQGAPAQHDHAKMMDECMKAMAEGKCKEHCQAMMKQHGTAAATPAAKADGHAGHAH